MEETKKVKTGGGVTAAAGFKASGIHAGLKKNSKDLAVLYSEVPASAAGVFTTNKVKGAPLLLTMKRLEKGEAQALVVNSGNANTCNGEQGIRDAAEMASVTARALNIPEELVLVASTGVIGQKMPMDKVTAGIQSAVAQLNPAGGAAAAEAIMTTDNVPKECAAKLKIGEKTVTVGGMAKGSGMIHPNMATMLAFITTDAAVSASCLKKALRYAVDRSFNMITVDGDTSTNDMVVVMANGMAQNKIIDAEDRAYFALREVLTAVCIDLAKKIARDGEGATKLLEVKVVNAVSENDARLAARAVAGSNLVKSAVFGKDANWGRILCAAGYSGANFDPNCVDVFLGDEQVAKDGGALNFDEERALKILEEDTVRILLDFKNKASTEFKASTEHKASAEYKAGAGPAACPGKQYEYPEAHCDASGGYEATAWGCDLTYEYVRINASYRT